MIHSTLQRDAAQITHRAQYYGAGGRVATVIVPDVPTPIAVEQPRPNVVDVLLDVVKPVDGRKRIEIEDIHRAYVGACKTRGALIAAVEVFGPQAKAFADAAGIRTLANADKVYWCGVKLVA